LLNFSRFIFLMLMTIVELLYMFNFSISGFCLLVYEISYHKELNYFLIDMWPLKDRF
jgi:hypothetical protein